MELPMENEIVTDFERLRVFSNSIGRMDDLVQDLSMALEDAANHKYSKSDGGRGTSSSSIRRHPRKRRGRRRRPTDVGNLSESSHSSLDEALKDYMENCAQQSDSDDLALAQHIVRLTMPLSGKYVPSQVESDSVNESMFSPVRPQRRRKKYKSMAIDPDPGNSLHDGLLAKPKYQRQVKLPHCSMGTSPIDSTGFLHQGKESNVEDAYPGKRKRSTRPKSEYHAHGEERDEDNVDMGSYSQEGSGSSSTISTSSSTESGEDDYSQTHEADDEQSDFFHESGPSCGIPGVIPWWENERVNSSDESICTDKQFQKILNGSFQHLSKSSQIAFKARMTKIMKHCGREIRFGRRKLKGQMPSYSVQRFIEERHKWNHIQGKLYWPGEVNSNGNHSNSSLTESKRQRKTPPPTEGLPVIGGLAEPIAETNIGNRMLQNMGWSPGTGLGSDGSGIRIPIMATLRPRRQGLGMGDCPSASSSSPSQKTMHTQNSQYLVSGKEGASNINDTGT